MPLRRWLLGASVILFLAVSLLAQEGFPLFTTDFPPEEFAARRAKVYEAIGKDAFAVIQGAPSPPGYTRFRQSNDFYYLCGIEVPHAYLLLDGATKRRRSTCRTATRAARRARARCSRPKTPKRSRSSRASTTVSGTDLLAEHLAQGARRARQRDLYTPLARPRASRMSRDLAMRAIADSGVGPVGRPRRPARATSCACSRSGSRCFEVEDLSPDPRRAAADQEPARDRADPQGDAARRAWR